jgi:predicted kinase
MRGTLRRNSMTTLYLMVGLPCSGKTTRAKELEDALRAIRLTPDEWHVNLFGHDVYDPEHDKRHGLIEAMLWQIAARALALGTNVILDFGFWAKEEREDFRSRARKLGAGSEIIYMDVDDEELMRRVRVRNDNLTNTLHYIPEELMLSWMQLFQKPDGDELLPREME